MSTPLPLQTAADQEHAWTSLRTIFTSVRYLARQRLAFRGHSNDDGSFNQLMKLRAGDVSDLQQWLQRRNNLASGSRQNEVLDI